MSEFDYVRNTYGVPARKGGRVEYTGGGAPQFGTITGSRGGYVLVLIDGERESRPYHATWELRYLEPDGHLP